MNCKKGDMAFVVRGKQIENRMKIVKCIAFIGSLDGFRANDLWLVDKPMVFRNACGDIIEEPYAPDSALLPIRPGDLHETTDERKEVTA